MGVQKVIAIRGRHIIGNLYECEPRKLCDIVFLTELVKRAAEAGNMTLLDIKSWKIGPGASIVGIILESHIAIHTWPERKFAAVDVYSCGFKSQPERAFEVIASSLEAKHVEVKVLDRNYEVEVPT